MKHWCLYIIGLVVVAALLVGCSQQTDLTLRADESWELRSYLSLNLEVIPNFSGEVEGFEIEVQTGALTDEILTASFNQLEVYYDSQGYDASWSTSTGEQGNETAYTLLIKGQGWDSLSKLTSPPPETLSQLGIQSEQAESYGIVIAAMSDGQLHFEMGLPESTPNLGALFPISFRLHGGKISSAPDAVISTNKTTAIWSNPSGKLEAVLTPVPLIEPAMLIGGAALVFVIVSSVVGGLWLISQRGPRRPGSPQRGHRPPTRRPAPRQGRQ